MAGGDLIKEFCDEVTCPICLEYFKDPVMTDCGHSFCRFCLTRCWEESDTDPSCPECRETVQQRNFRPSRQLVNLVELIKKLEREKGAECERAVCERHQEPLKLFCKDDLALICVVCDRSNDHRDHSVLPMEEASQEYKENIQAQLESLKEETGRLIAQELAVKERSQESLNWLAVEKWRGTSAFQAMQWFHEDKKSFWLAQFGVLEKKIEERQNENVARLSEEVSSLLQLIPEIERKCQQPASEFLQDIKSTWSRCQRDPRRQLVELSPGLEETLGICSRRNTALEKAVKNCKESLERALHEVNVTLDPATAHPLLILSEDEKSARRGGTHDPPPASQPANPERFDTMPCVLGREKFASGRHWWLMELEGPTAQWAVGVARESVKRKGEISLNPNEGIWAVRKNGPCMNLLHSDREFSALTYPNPTTLSLSHKPWKIRVSLDYDEGCVWFSDAVTGTPIFTFPSASFSGESICPFFCLYSGASLKC